MSSKWKCLSQEEVLFLSLLPGDTLNILIDRKLIVKRQESPEAFVTLTIVAGAIAERVKSGLKTAYSHFTVSLECMVLPCFDSSHDCEKELFSSAQPYYQQGDLCGLWKAILSLTFYENILITLLHCL